MTYRPMLAAAAAVLLTSVSACGNGPMFGDYTPPTLPPMPSGSSVDPSAKPEVTGEAQPRAEVGKSVKMGDCKEMLSGADVAEATGGQAKLTEGAGPGCWFEFEAGAANGVVIVESKKQDRLDRVLIGDFEKDELEGNTMLVGKMSDSTCDVAVVLDDEAEPTWLLVRGAVYGGGSDSCPIPRKVLEKAFSKLQPA